MEKNTSLCLPAVYSSIGFIPQLSVNDLDVQKAWDNIISSNQRIWSKSKKQRNCFFSIICHHFFAINSTIYEPTCSLWLSPPTPNTWSQTDYDWFSDIFTSPPCESLTSLQTIIGLHIFHILFFSPEYIFDQNFMHLIWFSINKSALLHEEREVQSSEICICAWRIEN